LRIRGCSSQEQAKTEPAKATETQVEEKGFGVFGTIEVAGDGSYLPAGTEGLVQRDTLSEKSRKVLATLSPGPWPGNWAWI
jgi:hypothetical protein